MNTESFLLGLLKAKTDIEIQDLYDNFEQQYEGTLRWDPIGGRENNSGQIAVSSDPGRSMIERVTNAIDAILEAEHSSHNGLPICRSPRSAAQAWLALPHDGISKMTTRERQKLADKIRVRVTSGQDPSLSVVEVRDYGIGISPEEMPETILSLGQSNKLKKHYVSGTYGQGGSSTFSSSRLCVIASKPQVGGDVAFTIVRYQELPPEIFKTGNYAYLTEKHGLLHVVLPDEQFEPGTVIRHVGYDLSKYSDPFGPTSLYGLLNRYLFDPILPFWLEWEPIKSGTRSSAFRRVIKGSRNSLKGASDDGDESSEKQKVIYNVPEFSIPIGEFGAISIEYWVLSPITASNKNPIRSFVEPTKPIILTLNGQNHAELTSRLIKVEVSLPFLAPRLICHVSCDTLIPEAKRQLFASTREDVRRGALYDRVLQQIVKALSSDHELQRLNREARDASYQYEDETSQSQMKKEVASIVSGYLGASEAEIDSGGSGKATKTEQGSHKGKGQKPLLAIPMHEPPTYIHMVWGPDEPISFYHEQRRWLRIETDAMSDYHNTSDPSLSRVNLIINGKEVAQAGSTPLCFGRMRFILDCHASGVPVGTQGIIRVELSRTGLATLSDERTYEIVEVPSKPSAKTKTHLPDFKVIAVKGPSEPIWSELDWPSDIAQVASSSILNEGKLLIYYSEVFPSFSKYMRKLEAKDQALARSFVERYKIWIAVHSLLMFKDSADGNRVADSKVDEGDKAELFERDERCRTATMASIIAFQEVKKLPQAFVEQGD